MADVDIKTAPLSCWYVKDFADGWIKFYDPQMALKEAEETGAIMIYAPAGVRPNIGPIDGRVTRNVTLEEIARFLEEHGDERLRGGLTQDTVLCDALAEAIRAFKTKGMA